METIDELKEWLKKPGNTQVQVATALEYKSSVTVIDQWVNRKCNTKICGAASKENS